MTIRNFNNTTTIGTLTGPAASSAVTLTVQNFSQYPAVPFTVTIDRNTATEEIALVTAVNGSTLTVTRGFDGTASQAHAAGAAVEHTAGAIEYSEANQHVNASAGVHGTTGELVGAEGAQDVFDKTLVSPILQADETAGDAAVAYDPTGDRNLFRGMNAAGDDVFVVDTNGKLSAQQVQSTGGISTGGAVSAGSLTVSGASTLTGQTTVAHTPTVSTDAANKGYVDGKTWPTSALTDAASAPTGNVVVKRDAAGRAQMTDPSVAADVATKNYVDTQVTANKYVPTDTGWKNLTLNSPVVPSFAGAKYRIINGIVYVLITENYAAGAYPTNFVHCTLPAEARPAVMQVLLGNYYGSTVGEIVTVNTDGTLVNNLGTTAVANGIAIVGCFPLNP